MRRRPGLLVVLLSLAAAPSALAQCVSLTAAGSAYTQSFDSLSNTAGSTTNNLTITGWFLTESGGGARDNEQYAVDTGGSNTGDTYSYGSAGSTDRALGGLQSGTLIPVFGACFTNDTGSTVTSLDVAYTGEQWRLGTASRADQIDFQYSLNATSLTTGTWTDVDALDFVTPNTTTTGAKDGNAAGNRTAVSSSIASLSIANGATFWVRWSDLNATSSDDGLAVDDLSLTPQGSGPVVPSLSINDVSQAEGDSGTTTFVFTVSLSAPAGPGGVTFDIATADGTATTADNDYVAQSLTGQTIPAGASTYAFNVTVTGDTTVEPNQTFFVNVTNVTGANVGDAQGLGAVLNDDVTLTSIHDIQGPGALSPLVGASVTTRGVVTGVRSNGFYLQEPDASVDADPATSEGVFVFTSSAPPAAAVVGALVQVTGTVVEFVPASDPFQPPLTEVTSPTVTQISTGQPLPVPVPLTTTFPDPAGPHDQLERLEGMRVSVASLTVVAPTGGTISEANATATSNGVFYGVVTGVPRPFREPGIPAPDPAPSGGGTIPPIPRFDSNPERIRVDSDALVGAPALDLATGAIVTGLVGPLDYSFRTYSILPDLGAPLGVSDAPSPSPVTPPAGEEVTVASYNIQRFFDTVNDPGVSDVVLTPAAFDRRLTKASAAVRTSMRMPDIVGVVEVENLPTLQALAARISSDALAAAQPDPQYAAYLVEGNDVGGIDVGFLVRTDPVSGTTPRVTVTEVVQELAGTLFVNPDSSTEALHDRPPLRLGAVVTHANGASFPITVVANHLRSLNSVNSEAAGSSGWPTAGARVRAKRLAQAVDLANLVQARQAADPAEHIVLVGDFNAFEVNDGLVDVINVLTGTPVPDDETAVPGDGVDLVNPDLVSLVAAVPAAQRYGYVFDGNAQNLDHVLVNATLVAGTVARRVEHARLNADAPEVARNDASGARLSDHDPLVAYFRVPAFEPVHTLTITAGPVGTPNPVMAGGAVALSVTADDSFGHALAYAWTASCPALADNGSFGDATIAAPTWTAPSNTTGVAQSCQIQVTVDDGAGLTATGSFAQQVSPLHVLWITDGPAGTPNPVASGAAVTVSVTASDSLGHALAYAWTASCPALADNGSFGDATIATPTWTAPANTTGVAQSCQIQVVVSDGQGLSQTASHAQQVSVIQPGGLGKTSPADGATTQLTSVALAWTASAGATEYEYCVSAGAVTACGTSWVPVAAPGAVVNGLRPGTTYSWQVRATGPGASTLADGGAWWTFTTRAATSEDVDADGLPDAWEAQFGLDPADGALGDPDGDGRTNLDEWRDDTHPRGFHAEYFAEGATSPFFRTRIALANLGTAPAHVQLRFSNRSGAVVTHVVRLLPRSRGTVDVASIAGMASAEFSTVVESDGQVVVDRTMTWDADGYGDHAERGIPAPATTWYLAEGATHSGFNLFYLLQNPNDAAVDVEVTYLRPAPRPPVTRQYRVAARSRANVWVNTEGPELASVDVSAVITATQPITVERAMYFDAAGRAFGAGHAGAGIVAPGRTWTLAEGATGAFFDTFVLVMNPSAEDAAVTATYLLPGGVTVEKHYVVPARSRFNVWVDLEDPLLADTAVSAILTSTNDVPVVVERAMYWPGPAPGAWREAHVSAGQADTATMWAMAEGEEGGGGATQTYLLIANTSAFAGLARVALLYEDGTADEATLPLNARSRTDVAIGAVFPQAAGRRFAVVVESLPAPGASEPAQVVVERAMYSDAGGVEWAAGTCAPATPIVVR